MYQMRAIPHKIAMSIKGDNAYKLRAQYLEYGLTLKLWVPVYVIYI